MKGKISSFITAALITVIILSTLTVISTRSFLSDTEEEKDSCFLPELNISFDNGFTVFLKKLLSFNEAIFPDFLTDFVEYNVKKTAEVSKTALDLCVSAIKYTVSVP